MLGAVESQQLESFTLLITDLRRMIINHNSPGTLGYRRQFHNSWRATGRGHLSENLWWKITRQNCYLLVISLLRDIKWIREPYRKRSVPADPQLRTCNVCYLITLQWMCLCNVSCNMLLLLEMSRFGSLRTKPAGTQLIRAGCRLRLRPLASPVPQISQNSHDHSIRSCEFWIHYMIGAPFEKREDKIH